mgnify:CR=1 FL=1
MNERDLREQAEVAAAVLESHPNDFSEEHEMSLHALGQSAAANSHAALG